MAPLILLLITIGNIVRGVIVLPFILITEILHALFNYTAEKHTARKNKPKKNTMRVLTTHIAQHTLGISMWITAIRSRLPRIQIHPPKFKLYAKKTTDFEKQFTLWQIKIRGITSFIIGVILTLLFIFVPYNAFLFLRSLPNPQLLTQRNLEVSTKIFDRNGILLYEIYADQNRTPVPLSRIPQHVIDATIAIEDREFYYHLGFSPRGIVRALKSITINKQFQGGSTITQQLIKSALLTPEPTIIRKTKEILLAFWAERIYTKDQILEMYFNQVPYGGTAWGIESASQTYFHTSVSDITLAQAALLAGLPAAPSEYSPFGSHPEKALVRQKEVLESMVETGVISTEIATKTLREPLMISVPTIAIHAPHFVMYVKELLEKKYGPRLVEHGGLRVVTSLDASLQTSTEHIVQTHIDSLGELNVGNGAALITSPKTGEILAMVGSRDYFDTNKEGNVNVVTSIQQPGSAIKVVTYAAALELGMTAATLIDDSPITYKQVGGPDYSPVNYDGRFHGMVPLRSALANSYNIPAVKILDKIGLATMIEKGRAMGISSWEEINNYGLSLTLGGGEVTMLEMATVFGSLANEGVRMNLIPILEVSDYTGRIIEKNTPTGENAVNKSVAWILSHILADNTARANAFGTNSALVIPNKTVSVKTGTSNDKRDNWAVGYTPSFVTTVWVGNNDNTPMNPRLASGITGAAPIWHDIMVEILKNREDEIPEKPSSILSIPCFGGKTEYFIEGTQPANGRCFTPITPSPQQYPLQ